MKNPRTYLKISFASMGVAILLVTAQFFFVILPIYRITGEDLTEAATDAKLRSLQLVSGILLTTVVLLVAIAAACIVIAAIVNLKKDARK